MATTTKSKLAEIMEARKSVRVYDPEFTISKVEIEELLQLAISAPSSSNLQPWRFIVFQDQEVKKELRAIANNQAQVEESSAVIAVLGNLEAYKQAEQIYSQNVEAGFMDAEMKERIVTNTVAMYSKAPDTARMNIASYDAGLVSMQFMLAAKEKGYDTVPMGGFDKAKFTQRFELPDHLFPVVLIALGKAAAPARESTRLPLEAVTQFI